MNWTEGPATWKQLRYLSQFGYKPDHPLTKTEASDLIRNFGGQPDSVAAVTTLPASDEPTGVAAQHLRQAVEAAKRSLDEATRDNLLQCQEAFDSALARRQIFWVDTCRDVAQMRLGSKAVVDLYRQHGCLFNPPTPVQ